MELGQPGEVFNVCTGHPHTMQDILDALIGHSRAQIEVKVDQSRFRPVDIPVLYGDYTALKERTDWSPQIPLAQTLADVLNEWRQIVGASEAQR
jgi:GDP-4-dehydro-6-deoxy-D-mannose reductase